MPVLLQHATSPLQALAPICPVAPLKALNPVHEPAPMQSAAQVLAFSPQASWHRPSPQTDADWWAHPLSGTQESVVQALPSSQETGTSSHKPSVGLQVAMVQWSSVCGHDTGVLLHVWLEQASSVHKFSSSQSTSVLQHPGIAVPAHAP